jgi:hypothetical protein
MNDIWDDLVPFYAAARCCPSPRALPSGACCSALRNVYTYIVEVYRKGEILDLFPATKKKTNGKEKVRPSRSER